MPIADFRIRTHLDDRQYEVQVVVYETLRGLRRAATNYENITRRKGNRIHGQFSDTLGICHRFELRDRHGNRRPFCATVRYALPYTGVGVVSHEMAHAAVGIHEDARPDWTLSPANDEGFCWVLGDLVRQAINGMNEHGVFDVD